MSGLLMNNGMAMVNRPVLRYHGGKWKLAQWIISYFPEHRTYTEVFGGAASVLLQKKRSYAEVYNDRWDVVVNVFRVLRNEKDALELTRRLELTPFSRTEFELCSGDTFTQCTDPIELARMTIFRSFSGFGSGSANVEHNTGFRSSVTRPYKTPADDWVNYSSHISSFVERLRGVVIENRDYKDVLIGNDGIDSLHYVDPPYVMDTRSLQSGNGIYAFEMTDDQHVEMAQVLHSLSGMVVLSGYDGQVYRDLFSDWTMVRRMAYADGARERTECLWLNGACADRQKQLSLF